MKKLILLLGLCMSLMAQQQEASDFFDRNYDECMKGMTTRFAAKHRESEGVGYKDGYTTLELFFAPNSVNRLQYFLDARGHVFNNGKFASNIGTGMRIALYEKLALGLNGYWDYRQVKHLPCNQMGGGFELLSAWADFRLNGYFPVGDKTYVKHPQFRRFSGNQILVRQKSKSELTTIYGEIGAPIPGPFRAVNLYLAAGPYYIFTRTVGLQGHHHGKTPAAWGGKFRAAARVYDGIELGLDVTYDHVFTWNVQGVISFSFPFGPANLRTKGSRWKKRYEGRCNDAAAYMAMMTQPVQRNEIIPILEKRFVTPLSENCVFVNNAAVVNGNGTFEFPFNSLAAAQAGSNPFDCIYVFEGSGTYAAPVGGFLLQHGQVVTGSSIPFIVDGVTIPAMTTNPPVFTNPGADVIFLTERNTVQGITVDGGSRGVVLNGAGNFTIDQMTIQNLTNVAIFGGILPAGEKVVTNSIFQGNMTGIFPVFEITMADVRGGSIHIANNTMTTATAANAFINIGYGAVANSDLAISIGNNTMTNTAGGTGVAGVNIAPIVQAADRRATMVVAGNIFNATAATGLNIDGIAQSMNVQVLRNAFQGHGTRAVDIQSGGGGIENHEVEALVQNNTFATDIRIRSTGGAATQNQVCLTLTGNSGPTYTLNNLTPTSAPYRVKSPNGALSGVSGENTGVIGTAGVITFVPPSTNCY